MDKEALRPRSKQLVMDLLQKAGMDVSDWANYGDGKKPAAANPKYCYEWSFKDAERLVVNLWYEGLETTDNGIVYRGNFRHDASENKRNNPGKPWARRGQKLDEHIRDAAEQGLVVRAVINDGSRRSGNTMGAERSAVRFRELDSEPWSIRSYDAVTGECVLVRGQIPFVDQFLLRELMGEVEKIEHTYQVYERNRKVREAVLLRAKGRCEFCGQLGFRMDDGRRYLETHHVVPLYEGGDDNMENVIALCATHHREAHHAENRLDLRMAFVKRLADYRSRAVPA